VTGFHACIGYLDKEQIASSKMLMPQAGAETCHYNVVVIAQK
jgi:hypothetical protein